MQNEKKTDSGPKIVSKLVSDLRKTRRAGCPLVSIATPDANAILETAKSVLNGKADGLPVVLWDVVRSTTPATEPGREYIAALCTDPESGESTSPKIALGNPVALMSEIFDKPTPDNALVIMLQAPDWIQEAPARQALKNLRDKLKTCGAQVWLVGSLGWKVPPELKDDIVSLSEPLPAEIELEDIARTVAQAAGQTEIDPLALRKAADIVCGVNRYGAEQTLSLNVTKTGFDNAGIWDGKRTIIEAAGGLKVYRGKEKFAQLGGLFAVKDYFRKLADGPEPARCILWIDEIEKIFGSASSGDTSGVSQGYLATLLQWTQDNDITGSLFLGVPGGGKSFFAKALAGELEIPCLSMDVNGMKSSLMGSSEANLRANLATVDAIGRGRVWIIATSNGVENVPPEFLSRLTLSSFFFDSPNQEEQGPIWNLCMAAFNLPLDMEKPACQGWTGREIKATCANAYRMRCSLVDAAAYTVPVTRAAPEKIAKLHASASGKYPSASYSGLYINGAQGSSQAQATQRKIQEA
jgi:hypothetical protein